jgi:diaminopimelate epimerase
MLNFVKILFGLIEYFCSASMTLQFSKYQGTGNDFILLDDLNDQHDKLSIADIQILCDRKFGVGADGLICIRKHSELDFEMVYYNADGTQSFCGNGARCAVAFAASLGLIKNAHTFFAAIDGPHEAWICESEVKLKMSDVAPIQILENAFELHTGSPHYILLDADHSELHVTQIGRQIRYNDTYQANGINVNLLDIQPDFLRVATYERGVEAETLSCGTGVTAAALTYAHLHQMKQGSAKVKTKGGNLSVQWQGLADGSFEQVFLTGPTQKVFSGIYEFKR